MQQALSNAWLKAQGLVSVKDLWCKAQGYTVWTLRGCSGQRKQNLNRLVRHGDFSRLSTLDEPKFF